MPSCAKKTGLGLTNSFAVLGLLAFGAPVLASPAQDVLTDIEEQCIQPGASFDTFTSVPNGWTRVESGDLKSLFEIAAAPVAVFTGEESMRPGDDPADFRPQVDKAISRAYDNLVEAHDENRLLAMTHNATGATLVIEMQDRDWLHTECSAWPASGDTALKTLMHDRWTLPIPDRAETPFGTRHELSLDILRNDTIAQLNVELFTLPPEVSAHPVLLRFKLATP